MTIAIVGGGISGLALAHALLRREQPVLLLEATERLGGTIRSNRRDGFTTEAGPNGFLDNEPATRALVAALQLSDRIRVAEPTAKKRFVYRLGAPRQLPMSPPGLLGSDILPLAAKLRLLGEIFSGRARDPEADTLASFGRRHFGKMASAVLVDAMQSGIYAGDPEKLSVAAAFPRLAELEREHRSLLLGLARSRRAKSAVQVDAAPLPTHAALTTFEGGLETLVRALGDGLGERARRGAEVTSLSRTGTGWRMELASGSGASSIEADRVVLALPSYAASKLVHRIDPTLASELSAIEYAPVAVVHVGYRRSDLASPPEGFGILVPAGTELHMLGSIFISSIFPWRADPDRVLLTCMLGGARQPQVLDAADDSLLSWVREDLRRALRIDAFPCFREIVRWRRAIPQYNIGHLARVRRIDESISRLPGLFLAGNSYRGVGINDCIRHAAVLADQLAG